MLTPLHPKAVVHYGMGVGDRGGGVPTLQPPEDTWQVWETVLVVPKAAGDMRVDVLLASSG